ncbi:hypothetical protein SELMODRAFT_412673 [Selaginella moellendorffii]|uniref:Leucine-rich repeat-containing N-terminal plant-type domain-containing protein n=1 Tax=Selaginella moellendorffii TaxID=88036 RepID=D8RL42_SELML|nr:receptor kinase-like protein Xa21 [Selaginella moellendorffii]EFJ26849.1 hypothetical protein SELMODRAFT_412673 [Selaginella moellendorffii]|eukprot:XP_002971932.1 receptor kinase-like protein Xa21 [Selaginella moellendorffii]
MLLQVLFFACFLLSGDALPIASSARATSTAAVDIEALKELKAAIDPATIAPSSCLASWDFSHDPCASISTSFFVCGFRCSNGAHPMRITEITLDNVGYAGSLSPYLGNLSSLQVLDVSGNAFHGSIPESLSNLRSLLKLELSQNSISGWIPQSLGRLDKLEYLSLASNAIEGLLPASLNRLHSLERLAVSNNRLSGPIPLMTAMSSLLYFDGSTNRFSGWAQSELPLSLMVISLRNNQLQGRLPGSLTKLEQLEVLDLSHNDLRGPVPASLFTLPSLQQLNLAYNQFVSVLATPGLAEWEQVADSSQLIEIDLSFNKFQGRLPVFFVQMKRLTALSLGHNQFSGLIPIEYALKAVRMLIGAEPLMRLYLESNFLAGELPSPFLSIVPGEVSGSFVGNCLQRCPAELFFCQGGQQRSPAECSKFFESAP